MRVYEFAKALNLTSKDLLSKLKELKIPAKASTTTLDADAINRVRKALAAGAAARKAAQAKAASAKKAAGKAAVA